MFRLNNEACFVGLCKPTKGHMSLAKSALFPKKREIPIIRYKPSKNIVSDYTGTPPTIRIHVIHIFVKYLYKLV